MQATPEHEIERYLRCGEHDPTFRAWPGNNLLASAQLGDAALRKALIAEVRGRTWPAVHPNGLANIDLVALTQVKVAPMVRGLFPAREQEAVLNLLSHSVVILTPATIDGVLEQTPWLSTAWNLANLYLAGGDAELLAEDAPYLAGQSIGATCYLSPSYFDQTGRFDDYLVHEAAHIFHNCKRGTIGLPETRRQEWLLEIDYAKRETFAYACEAYSCIHALADGPKGRYRLLAEYAEEQMPADERVNTDEYMDILRDAIAVRNGWKRILQRCSTLASRSHSR